MTRTTPERTDVLLRASVGEGELRDVGWGPHDVGRHIGDKWNRTDVWYGVPLGAENRVVGRHMNVRGLRVEAQLVLPGDPGVALVLFGGGGHANRPDALRLLDARSDQLPVRM